MYLYLLNNKYEVLDAFKVFKAKVKKQCGKQIKILRSDRGDKFYGKYTEKTSTWSFCKVSSRGWYCDPIHHAWLAELK